MRIRNSIRVVDTHGCGHTCRVAIGGIPTLYGTTVEEKMNDMKENHDHIRRMLICEPRGYHGTYGAVIVDATTPEADFGVFFMETANYVPYSGVNSIAVGKGMIEVGIVKAVEPVTKVVMETCLGLVTLEYKVEHGHVLEGTVKNMPCFLLQKDVKIDLPDVGEIEVDICFGGAFYAMVNVDDLGLQVGRANIDELIHIQPKVTAAVKAVTKVKHPVSGFDIFTNVIFYQNPKNEGEVYKHVDIYGVKEWDRSPCGTGTSARMAQLYARGKMGLNEEVIFEGATGTQLRGVILEETEVGGQPAVLPQFTGKASVIGLNNLILEEDDVIDGGIIHNV
ncbi:MAG: proline racemase family protein [Clostridia bacterium]|nr:proline racemase family protein [Clostridia bacterium]